MSEPDEDDSDSSSGSSKSVKGTGLSDNGIHYMCDSITGSSCKPVVEWILTENLKGKHERLTLIISSYGGDVYASFALIDAILGSRIPVDTIGLGYIASAGLCIFIHGARRYVTHNTYILAHQWSGFKMGKAHELIGARKEEDWLMERFIDMHVRCSKLTRDEVKTKLMGASDTFLTAQEALEYGLADEIRMTAHAPSVVVSPTL